MDPRFGPAWIAFAHTFAMEGEHDHAVTAYSTCARMFTGYDFSFHATYVKTLMIWKLPSAVDVCGHGTHHLSNFDQADEALDALFSMCDGDSSLLNERGVMAYDRAQ